MDIHTYMLEVARGARAASREMASASSAQKSRALIAIADALRAATGTLLAANEKDVAAAVATDLDPPLLDRLRFDASGVERMAEGVLQVEALPDPVGEVTDLRYRPSGIQVGRMRVPLGVIGIIYESRPNVTADAAALCIKSGNACILRGGSEAIESNRAISRCVSEGLEAAGLSATAAQLVETTDRTAVGEMLTLDQYIDIIVPRGGAGLIERISRESRIPVIKHLDGICHVYVHAAADVGMAVDVAVNSKVSKFAVCNAVETVLIDRAIADAVLPKLSARYREHGLELRGCDACRAIVPEMVPATEADWSTEYLGPVLALRVVDGIDAAIEHINRYGSQHTDCIVTGDYAAARRFVTEVDSASVMVNASTQFADGFEYGLGAEVGISTDKLHARGPVGLEGLTTQKFVVYGSGEVRHR